MSKPIIEIENIGKKYRIGANKQQYLNLRDEIAAFVSPAARRARAAKGEFWALKDVSFSVQEGEALGIIGRNGAGKSTLLKVLSQITPPTEGKIRMRGRIASLLEVGTGFHPELTGRENIYLNGAILGMTRKEIARKFDEIVTFAEVERFLDTPVKRYSSGMYVRLAFAVAAHLDPEILIVDEVLAVGDSEFQKKCLGKMGSVAKSGRTVLFVSHNMGAVQMLCSHCVCLRRGSVASIGSVDSVVSEYLGALTDGSRDAFGDNPERSGNGAIRLTSALVKDSDGHQTSELMAGRPASLVFHYENPRNVNNVSMSCTVFNQSGVGIASLDATLTGFELQDLGSKGSFACEIPRVPFLNGQYRVAISLAIDGVTADLIPNALVFDVIGSVFYPTGKVPNPQYCTCLVAHQWSHESEGGSH